MIHVLSFITRKPSLSQMIDAREFKEDSWPDGAKFLDQGLVQNFVAQEYQVLWQS